MSISSESLFAEILKVKSVSGLLRSGVPVLDC